MRQARDLGGLHRLGDLGTDEKPSAIRSFDRELVELPRRQHGGGLRESGVRQGGSRWINEVPTDDLDPRPRLRADVVEAGRPITVRVGVIADRYLEVGRCPPKPGPNSDLITAARSHVIFPQKFGWLARTRSIAGGTALIPFWPSLLAMLLAALVLLAACGRTSKSQRPRTYARPRACPWHLLEHPVPFAHLAGNPHP
jgi:hypothetical protein